MEYIKSSGWCWPTIIYIVSSSIGSILVITNQQNYLRQMKITSDKEKYLYLLKNVIQQVFWTFVLYMLCSRRKHNIAWVVLFAPFIISILLLFFWK
jgi:uncharacterized integral membrane protein